MKTTLVIVLVIIAALIAGGIYLLTTQGSSSQNTQTDNPAGNGPTGNNPSLNNSPSPQPKTYNIEISNFAFSLSTLTIKRGDIVVWTNQDSTSHTITSDSGSELGSSPLSNGQAYSHTFNTIGTFDYHCSIHPSMKAKIIVE